ncbi:Lipoprotein [Klebsiella pneumoniae]
MMPLTVSLLLTGCVIKPQQGLLFCETANPIYLSKEDQLTQESKRQILAHDIVGERVCGWGQPNRIS